MAVKRRKSPPTGKGAASAAPSSSGGVKLKKRSLPVTSPLDKLDTELGALIAEIKKSGDYADSIRMASDNKFQAPRLETGILGLDLILGGGWPMGRASHVIGEFSAGKSTLALLSVAALHRQNPDAIAVLIDTEGTADRTWASRLGVDNNRLVIVEPESGEHAVDLADSLVRTKEVNFLIVDSLAMLIPVKEVEAATSQEFMGLQGRLIGKFVRKVTQALLYERKRDHYAHMMMLNQYRMKIGLVFGDPRTTPGGKAPDYFVSHKLEAKNKEIMFKDSDGEDVVKHNEHTLTIKKDKTGGRLKESMFRLVRTSYDGMPEGFVDQGRAFHSFGAKIGVVDGPAQSFSVDGIKGKFRGAPAFMAWAVENPDEYYAAVSKIVEGYRKKWGLIQ